jgi:hypothetical protein
MPRSKRKAAEAEAFSPIRHWSGCTHGKVFFATEEEARAFAAQVVKENNSRELGWYWLAGSVAGHSDGTWSVVIP